MTTILHHSVSGSWGNNHSWCPRKGDSTPRIVAHVVIQRLGMIRFGTTGFTRNEGRQRKKKTKRKKKHRDKWMGVKSLLVQWVMVIGV